MPPHEDDHDPLPLPAFITRVRNPDDPVPPSPFSDRHPLLALLILLLLVVPLLVLIGLGWLLLYCLLRPLDLLLAWICRHPLDATPLTSQARTSISRLVELLL